MNNFYLIDKPTWITSFDIIRRLRKKFQIRKMGHTGTLDPLATWCMLIATGNYTKLIPFFEKDKKKYEATILLDWESKSFDLWTPVTKISEEKFLHYKKNITLKQIQNILLEKFSGKVQQIPPKYSALKINGKKAVDLVREGKEVQMKARNCYIYYSKILSFSYPRLEIEFEVSAGTYIRSLAADIWAMLWTWGYLWWLKRTAIWNLNINDAISLDALSVTNSLWIEKIFSSYKQINLSTEQEKEFSFWRSICFHWNYKNGEKIFVVDEKNGQKKVIYISEYKDGQLFPKRKI